ncbi:hypothetical protein VTL71DRAFT_2560 [Oculimacula yallundae]|uniref:AA9 family lytic polysaccharide monooxygenase n=1 Tax=Oculimacula yallundae TaxID=86028 RepID=A0ABR4C982_9HELO
MHISRLVFGLSLGALRSVAGHSVFTTLFVNDIDQGDGTCVRMPMDAHNATNPISDLSSSAMACGFGGTQGVARVCTIPSSAKMGFQFRQFPDNSQAGTIDSSHMGPCAVYMKYVSSAIEDPGVGDGWFKIASSGYDESTKKWCTEKLSANNGVMSFSVPEDLAGGYYLIRPELLTLQDADKDPPNPQFYTGCAQVFLNSTGRRLPRDTVSIPGYVGIKNESVLFDLYKPIWPYLEPGPEVYTSGTSSAKVVEAVIRQTEGLLPRDAYLTNANWWGVEVSSYDDEDGCWNASKSCYTQADACYKTAPPTGSKNCKVWEARCSNIQTACDKEIFTGPPVYTLRLDPSSSSTSLEDATTQMDETKPTSSTELVTFEPTKSPTTSINQGRSRTRTQQITTANFGSVKSEKMDFGSMTALPETTLSTTGGSSTLRPRSSTITGKSSSDSSSISSLNSKRISIRPTMTNPEDPVTTSNSDTESSPASTILITSKVKPAQASSTTSIFIPDSSVAATASKGLDFGTRKSASLSSIATDTVTRTPLVTSSIVATTTFASNLSVSESDQTPSMISTTLSMDPIPDTLIEPVSTSTMMTTVFSTTIFDVSSALDSSTDDIPSIEIIPPRTNTTSVPSTGSGSTSFSATITNTSSVVDPETTNVAESPGGSKIARKLRRTWSA